MDFLLTKEQIAFRNRLRSWFADNLPANWRNRGHTGTMSEAERGAFLRSWENTVFRAGFTGLHWPKAYGGHGLSLVEHFLYGEEAGRAGAPIGINPIGRELVAGVLLHAGTEEQKRFYLPRIASGEHIWCQGFSEPNAGSDLTALLTKAELRDGVWYVTGHKIWTSYAQHADYCLLLARTSREEKKHQGLSLLAVPMGSKGIARRGIQQLDGVLDFNEVTFDDVAVPAENIIGPVGKGWAVSGAVLAIERATTRLYRQALYLTELDHAWELNRARGGPRSLANSDHLRQTFAGAYAQLLVLRAVNINFVGRLVAGETVGAEASISKQCWSHFHQDSTAAIAEILGDDFWLPPDDERDLNRFLPEYFHSRAETIFAGTSEIQNTIIAERILGMPR
jgi:alkylation response protein AidB-like acyl-CoA dehydrogenase